MKNQRIPELISEINDDLTVLSAIVTEIIKTNENLPSTNYEQRIYLESIALKLHNFYTGIENIFAKIADEINGGLPESFDWHKRLLRSMVLDIENKRPHVISENTFKSVQEFLAFRHVVRNLYGFEIDREKLQRLIFKIENVFSGFMSDIKEFITYLENLKP